ncbi:XdhC/CoxI family protein [Flavobacteriaceae bacterium AU392]|nr:XdhC/CoxI family protein [Flavobacteriaceae bacterium]RKM84193.1 XdhC/CoxI family protein [Flavobacteriaceae bacterium AU392]
MTHEFKTIVENALLAKQNGLKSVLATVVALDGSSYRRPGVRMLILENGKMIGAVSGGCVEKEVLLQSESVFKTGVSKIMTYDGRYRLGCEGILYILIEQFEVKTDFFEAFQLALKDRIKFNIQSCYIKEEGSNSALGSEVVFKNKIFLISNRIENTKTDISVFKQELPPCFKLMIIGAEHDAVLLCQFANLNGWEVTIVSGPLEQKTIKDFPGAAKFYSVVADMMDVSKIDDQTAIVLMTHNYASDLKYLIHLKNTKPAYLGILGANKRREQLLSQFIEYYPEIDDVFLDCIYAPAGIDIGAETPQEIAVSIISEILSVIRNKKPISLRDKSGGIHD